MRWSISRAQSFALAVLSCLPFLGSAELKGQEEVHAYQVPSDALVEIVDAPMPPVASLSPDRDWMLLMRRPTLPSIAELAEEELRLAGVRMKPATNGPSRSWPYDSLALLRVANAEQIPIEGLPGQPRIADVSWSPDGAHIVFTNTGPDGIHLWLLEVASARARRLSERRLSTAIGQQPVWAPDGRSILALVVPDDRAEPPPAPSVPSGPVVQESRGRTAPARTYQDLLQNAHDEKLFEHYFHVQVVRFLLDGQDQSLGEPGIVRSLDPSPSGEFLLVETLHRPFSYLVPATRFPTRTDVWDRDGELVRRIADQPLQDAIPIAFGSVETGRRNVAWRADAPATLLWAEAQDGGDAGAEAELRDRLYLLDAPFGGEPRELAALQQRYGGMMWGRGDLALVTTWWWPTRNQRAWRVAPDDPAREQELLMEWSWEDRYNDPGRPEMVWNENGRRVLQTDATGEGLYLVGDGASPEGDRPFLDRWNLQSREKKRLFRSQAPHYEQPVVVLDTAGDRLLLRRESVQDPPNYFVIGLGTDEEHQLTEFEHPTPQLVGIQKELIRYTREDGVELTGTLYLPPDYRAEERGPLPVLLWAYPQEFKSADAAGQVTDSPYRFARVGWWSPLLWVAAGYVVLDDPGMPIVGEGEAEPNDTYVEQLVASARAAVEELARRGVGDRDRMAIGGHSYGAFMAANLLAHSDLFAAGIARSGAYNRTLTPFGFQAEERTFWEASDVYFTMSPFMHADKVDEPLLLIHGEADNNSGTFPMQSERLYSALKGLGGTARLVMLPHESHGYRGRESVLHVLWETERWLSEFVAGEPLPDGQTRASAAGAGDR
jgi:dipeptidyl aminopeptidase/acylaminoacyl peptidase